MMPQAYEKERESKKETVRGEGGKKEAGGWTGKREKRRGGRGGVGGRREKGYVQNECYGLNVSPRPKFIC